MEKTNESTAEPEESALREYLAERPPIETNQAELHSLAAQGRQAIGRANESDPRHPTVMRRGRRLVRLTDAGLEEWRASTLAEHLSLVAAWRKTERVVDPPRGVVAAVLDGEHGDWAPPVDRVVDVPVFASDGSLLTEPGYHPAARVVYRPAPGLGKMPEVTGSLEDLDEAAGWVRGEMFADFPFVSDADLANAAGLFVLPFVRDLIPGPTPMHPVVAPSPGDGKGSLVDAALYPGCGPVQKTPQIRDDDEMRKQVTTYLMSGAPAVVFDNLTMRLDSPALAAALTAEVWRDRRLGSNEEISMNVRNIWALTANNLSLTGEQARRMCPVFLDSGKEHPESRTFRRDLETWLPRNRARAVWAALTMVRAWQLAERPERYDSYSGSFRPLQGTRVLNSFGGWARTVGGIVGYAGFPDFLANTGRLRDYVEGDGEDAAGFLAAWHRLGLGPAKADELAETFWSQAGLEAYAAMPTTLREAREGKRASELGYFLRRNKDRVYGGLKVVHAGKSNGARRWQVVPIPVDGHS